MGNPGRAPLFSDIMLDNPERFGTIEFDKDGRVVSIEEKPKVPKSNYCITGIYFFDNKAAEYAKQLKPSARGELEITDLIKVYLEQGRLNLELLGQGFTWLDAGDARQSCGGDEFCENDGVAPAPKDRMPGRDRLSERMDLKRTGYERL